MRPEKRFMIPKSCGFGLKDFAYGLFDRPAASGLAASG